MVACVSPDTCATTGSGTPPRIKFDTNVCLNSCNLYLGKPKSSQILCSIALAACGEKSKIRAFPVAFWLRAPFAAKNSSKTSKDRGISRTFPFFVDFVSLKS